jgi:hypothetical protein
MDEISILFENVQLKKNCKTDQVFQILTPLLVNKFSVFLQQRRQKSGRPMTMDLPKFFEALYDVIDNGSKYKSVEKHYQIPKSTFSRYIKLLGESEIIKSTFDKINRNVPVEGGLLIVDTFTVKSVDGSEGLGRNPTDRGRAGLKDQLICDQNKIIQDVHLAPANQCS